MFLPSTSQEFPMKIYLLLLSGLLFTVGCNNTTTSTVGTRVSTRTGETVVKKLSLTAAKDQTITRGSTDKVDVSISRSNFDEPVTIAIANLPNGVEVAEKEMTIPNGATKLTLTLKAAADAALGEHMVNITASAPGLEKTTQAFKLTVKQP